MGVLLILAVIILAFVTGAMLTHTRKLTHSLDELSRRTDRLQGELEAVEDELRYVDDRRDLRRVPSRAGRDRSGDDGE